MMIKFEYMELTYSLLYDFVSFLEWNIEFYVMINDIMYLFSFSTWSGKMLSTFTS